MKRKGMLLASETLKMVIALICLVFLVYLLTSIYYATSNAPNKEKATETVRRISEVGERLRASLVLEEEVNDLTPAGWMVFGFVGNENKPNSCAGEDCLCICEEIGFIGKITSTQEEDCDEDGACQIIKNLVDFNSFEIKDPKSPTNILISRKDKWLEMKEI